MWESQSGGVFPDDESINTAASSNPDHGTTPIIVDDNRGSEPDVLFDAIKAELSEEKEISDDIVG